MRFFRLIPLIAASVFITQPALADGNGIIVQQSGPITITNSPVLNAQNVNIPIGSGTTQNIQNPSLSGSLSASASVPLGSQTPLIPLDNTHGKSLISNTIVGDNFPGQASGGLDNPIWHEMNSAPHKADQPIPAMAATDALANNLAALSPGAGYEDPALAWTEQNLQGTAK